jgi:hypothetical protein
MHLLGIDRQHLRATVPRCALAPSGLAAAFSVALTPADATAGAGCSPCWAAAPPDAEPPSPSPPSPSCPSSTVSQGARELGGRELFEGFCARRSRAAFKSASAFASNARACSGESPSR